MTTALSLELAGAQSHAAALFRAVEETGVVRPGETEESISAAIDELARTRFGVGRHWHRRVVRSGPNTRLPFRALPPDRVVQEDDIVSIDLGPVFGAYEADFGRTFVLGGDPEKHRLRDDLAALFVASQAFYRAHPAMTGRDLYAHVVDASAARGWGFGGTHAGHLVGAFPMRPEKRDAPANRIRPDNVWPMNAPDPEGAPRYWILEVHLLDPTGAFGGFFEELLTPSQE